MILLEFYVINGAYFNFQSCLSLPSSKKEASEVGDEPLLIKQNHPGTLLGILVAEMERPLI